MALACIRIAGSFLRSRQEAANPPRDWSAPSIAYLSGVECARKYGYPDDLIQCLQRGVVNERGRPINSRGFWGDEFSVPKPAKTYRIVALGGSTTEAPWPEALEDILRAKLPTTWEIEVINGGIVSYDSSAVRIRFEHDVRNIDPDLVLIYSGWNDWPCNLFENSVESGIREYHRSGDERALLAPGDPWVASNVAWFRDQRDRIQAFRDESVRRRLQAQLSDSYLLKTLAAPFEGFEDLVYLRNYFQRDDVLLEDLDQDLTQPSPFDESFTPHVWLRNLKEVVREAQRLGAETALVIPSHAYGCRPYRTQRCPGLLLPTVRDRYSFMTRSLPLAVRRLAAETGSLVVDHAAVFDNRPDRCELFSDEMHHEPAGLMLAAAATTDAIMPTVREALATKDGQ